MCFFSDFSQQNYFEIHPCRDIHSFSVYGIPLDEYITMVSTFTC